MKITLINPFTIDVKSLKVHGGSEYPSLGLAYIAAVLEKQGNKIKIIDMEVTPYTKKEFVDFLKQEKPDLIGIMIYTAKIQSAVRLFKMIKKTNPEILTLVGGPHTTVDPFGIIKNIPEVDFVVIGEGEFTTRDLVDSLQSKKELKEVKGIIYRKDGKIINTEPRELIKDIDELPFPARHLLPKMKNPKPGFRYKRLPFTYMITSRGCPNQCIFCNRIFGQRYRAHSAERVVDEIEFLVKNYGIKEIHFFDELFLLDRGRTEKICDLLKQRNLHITWSCNGRIDILSKFPELIPKIKKAGCWYISFGIESGNQDVLNFIKKGITLEDAKKVINLVHKAGIFTKGYFMIGHIPDTKKTIRQTIDFAKSLPLDAAQFSMNVPYPGTEQYEISKTEGSFEADIYEKMSTHSTDAFYAPKGLSKKYIKKMQMKAYREFYFRPKYILSQLRRINNFLTFKKYLHMGMIYFKAYVLKPFGN